MTGSTNASGNASNIPSSPLPRRSAQEQSKLERELIELFEQRITFNSVLGMKIDSVQPGNVRGHLLMQPQLVGHFAYGRLHGGVISAALDAFGAMALMAEVGERHPHESADQIMHRFARMGTIDLRIDYLRQAIGKRFEMRAKVLRLGGRVGNTRMEFEGEDGTLFAAGTAAYMVS